MLTKARQEVMHRGWARASKEKLANIHTHRQAKAYGLVCLARWLGTGHVVVCMGRVGMGGRGVGGIKL